MAQARAGHEHWSGPTLFCFFGLRVILKDTRDEGGAGTIHRISQMELKSDVGASLPGMRGRSYSTNLTALNGCAPLPCILGAVWMS